MSSWFNDPKQLVRTDKVPEFWPTKLQSSAERVNAASRFIIYAACVHYIIKRDVRVFILAATALSVLYIMEKSQMVKGGTEYYNTVNNNCQLPTRDNPMSNYLMGDNPERPGACAYPDVSTQVDNMVVGNTPFGPARSRSTLPKYQQNAVSRQFVSSPVTTAVSDQTGFAEWLYGRKNQPMCKSDPTMCDPNARGVQLEAFAGLDPNGDKRSGMHGFTHA
jgi:hypothetical protein